MFRKNIKETKIDEMKAEAMEAGDYETVNKLIDIETENEDKLLKERIKGIVSGYGTAMAGVAIGVVVKAKFKKGKGT